MTMTTPLRIALAVPFAAGVVAAEPAGPASTATTDAAFGTSAGT